MKIQLTKAPDGTGLRPVQFGVPPNFGGARPTAFGQTNFCGAHPLSVLGVTPETTGETPVPPMQQI
jgi:hypothetical protein